MLTDEQYTVIRDLGDAVQELAHEISELRSEVERLIPRNEFGMDEETAWATHRALHMVKHKECPLFKQEPCSSFSREWHSWQWQDYIDRFLSLEKRFNALLYELPRDLTQVTRSMNNESDFQGVEI